MNIRTAYGLVPPTGGTESQFRDKLSLASRVSNLLSVRNSKFNEFIKELNLLLEKYDEIFYQGNEALEYLNYKDYVDELEKRINNK